MSTSEFSTTVMPSGDALKQLIEQRAAVKDGHDTEYEALQEVLDKNPAWSEYDALQLAATCAAFWVGLCDTLAVTNPYMSRSKKGGAP